MYTLNNSYGDPYEGTTGCLSKSCPPGFELESQCKYHLPSKMFDEIDKKDSSECDIYTEKPTSEYITSYGTILYTYTSDKRLLFMSGEARDTIPYREFIKGSLPDKDIPTYISRMSLDEIERIKRCYIDPHKRMVTSSKQSDECKKCDCKESGRFSRPAYVSNSKSHYENINPNFFKILWKDLWINKNTRVYNETYPASYEIFMANAEKYQECFNKYNNNKKPRIFTKGRQKENEDEKDAATRETYEEGRIQRNNIKLLNLPPLYEQYIGNDGKKYQTKYFPGYTKYIPKKTYIYSDTPQLRKKFISGEVSDIYWEEFDVLYPKLDANKQKILKAFYDQIKDQFPTSKKCTDLSLLAVKRRWTI